MQLQLWAADLELEPVGSVGAPAWIAILKAMNEVRGEVGDIVGAEA